MDEKIPRLVEWSKGRKSPPLVLDINPTDKCNLKCLSCWQRSEKYSNIDSSYELPEKKLLDIVREAAKIGVKQIEITGGGEPLVRRSTIFKIMSLIKKLKIYGNITTNGTLFTPVIIKTLVDIGWDSITFSIDGPDAKTNDYLRGTPGAFENCMEALNRINHLKKTMNKKNPVIKFNTVLSNKNYEKMSKMIELAKNAECSAVNFEPMTLHSVAGKKLMLNKNEKAKLNKNITKAKKLAEKYSISTNLESLKSTIEKSKMDKLLSKEASDCDEGFLSIPCYEPWYHIVVKVDGSVQPCCLHDSKEENVQEKTLGEIWFGPAFEKIRDNISKKKFSKYCSICNFGQVLANRKIRSELAKSLSDENERKN